MNKLVADWLPEFFSLSKEKANAFIEHEIEEAFQRLKIDEDALLHILFLKAIRERLEDNAAIHQHIYLEQFEIPQIVLFDILINKMPFVVYGHQIVNHEMAKLMQGIEKAVLMDVGIGRGLQMVHLLNLLKQNTTLKELTIIAVEAFGDALHVAYDALNMMAKELPFSLVCHKVEELIENITAETLQQFIPQLHDVFIVNSAFTLHHIQDQEKRKCFFQLLNRLGASHILLLEPYSNHFTNLWQQRVLNAYKHYGAVFNVIDQLDITAQERKGLKVFFGREIDDVVGFADSQRYERHEEGAQWISYLQQANYNAVVFENIPANIEKPAIEFVADENNYLKMEHEGVTILSLIHAVKQQ